MKKLFITIACYALALYLGYCPPPTLTLVGRVPDVQVTGTVGLNYRIDYINVYGPTNAWVTLTTITLTNSPQHYLDVSAIGQPPRLYRAVQVQ